MSYLNTARLDATRLRNERLEDREPLTVTFDPLEIIDHGHAMANAAQAVQLLEGERAEYAKPRERRLAELLALCLPYVQEARQGRGDKALEKLIREELR